MYKINPTGRFHVKDRDGLRGVYAAPRLARDASPLIKSGANSGRGRSKQSLSINRPRDYGLILLAFFLQVVFAGSLSLFDAKPNFPIILAVFFALFTDERYGFESAFLSGILLDVFSIRFFGLNAILFSVTGCLIGRFNAKIYKESMVTHAILIFFAAVFILSAYRLFLLFENRFLLSDMSLGFVFSPSVFLSAMYSSLLGTPIYTFLCRVFKLGETSIL